MAVESWEGISALQQITAADGREVIKHGTPSFPCSYGFWDPSAFDYPWHWHDDLELVFIQKGTIVIATQDKRLVLRDGDAIFLNKGVLHAEFAYLGTSANECHVNCHPDLLCPDHESAIYTKYLGPILNSRQMSYMVFLHDGPMWQRETISHIKTAYEAMVLDEEFCEVTVREELTRVCLLMLKNISKVNKEEPSATTPRAIDRMKIMISYIHDHYSEDIDVTDIASSVNICARECQREFKQTIGESPAHYLASYRMQKSATMLAETDLSVSDIAYSCGFQSHSYFTKRFKDRYGHSPSEHRSIAAAKASTINR